MTTDPIDVETVENRKILLAIAGAQIPGGCDDCAAHAVVHYGVIIEAGAGMEQAQGLGDGVFRLAVYHDPSCPFYNGAAGPALTG